MTGTEIVIETEIKDIHVPIKNLTEKSKDREAGTETEIDENVNGVNLLKAIHLRIKTRIEIKTGTDETIEIGKETEIEIEDENVTELGIKLKHQGMTNVLQDNLLL